MFLKDSPFSTKQSVKIGDKIIDFSTPKIMGVLNVTPDSFFDGGKHNSLENAVRSAEKMIASGADFIDVGGYSSRPGAQEVCMEEEMDRTTPVVEAIHKSFPDVQISIDTFRKKVAEENFNKGATWVNDISAGNLDHKMISWIREYNIPYIAMHMRGNPQNMQSKCNYHNLIKEVISELTYSVKALSSEHPLILDPGFGFSKTLEQNYELMNNLEHFGSLNRPFIVGVSRKSMIYKVLKTSPNEALNGTTVLNTLGILKGASVLRVHDVRQAKEIVELLGRLEYKK
ncbi:MAG: dihydropteroate synthase [Flavobacteriales bacterium]|nr:dihydropteroate synthase [Flavobacteriales bacterium]